MMAHRRKVLRTLLLSGSGLMVFFHPGNAFSWTEAAKALRRKTGMVGDRGELQDVAFAVAGMT